jgi:hypothetical protein
MAKQSIIPKEPTSPRSAFAAFNELVQQVAAIRPDSQSVKLAEIMCIQFKQVGQDRGVFAQGGVKLNTSGRFICVFNHGGSCCDRPQAGSRISVEVGFVAYCSLAYSDLA